MASTVVGLDQPSAQLLPQPAPAAPRWWPLVLLGYTLAALLVHGYHPWADDGGLYVTGVEHLLQPRLFPFDSAFVDAHLRFSLFAPLLAVATRATGLGLPWILLLAELASIACTLAAARRVLAEWGAGPAAQLGGVTLLTAWWTLPVAGTALAVMDPYLTARSFSTPLCLLALAACLRWYRLPAGPARRQALLAGGLCVAAAALLHPLMAGYGACLLLLLVLQRRWPGRRAPLLAAAAALACAALLQQAGPHESAAVLAAERSRSYWYLSQWHSYELLGLAAPLALLAWLAARSSLTPAARDLCRAAVWLGLISVAVALAFAHGSASTHLVARLQPLRAFVMIYTVMILLLGALTAEAVLASPRRWTRWAAVTLLCGSAAMLFQAQRLTYPATPHLELPLMRADDPDQPATPNQWLQAFDWVRRNTPANALFALDADYIALPGEDAQSFRAVARRSKLPDLLKDGGEASIAPALSDAWLRGAQAQANLSQLTDAQRDGRLLPLGVTWMLLRAEATTTHRCPYRNRVVQVCQLQP